MPAKLSPYERALRDLPKRSNANIDATDAMQATNSQGPLWELAWAVLHELDLREEGEDDCEHVNPKVWRAWLTKHAPTDGFPQQWRR